MKHEVATALLARELSRARKAIALERLVPALVPVVLGIAFWAAFGLLGLQDRLAPLAGSIAAILAVALIFTLAGRALRRWHSPNLQDARARLARDAGFEPAEFDALEDQPSKLDREGLALWEHEQQRAREKAARAVAAPAAVDINRIDRFQLRWVALAAVATGVVIAGWEAPDRLARAFIPDPGPLLGDGPMQIEAWGAPAEYTGAGPISLTERIGQRVPTPPSMEVTVRVTGPVGAPFLHFDGGGVHRKVEFKKAADGAYETKLLLPPRGGSLRIVRFHTKARWIIAPTPDRAPTATLASPPAIKDDQLTFKWTATDDFGVRGLKLKAVPAEPPPGLVGAPPVYTDLEGPTSDPKTAEGEVTVDLATHPYAGLNINFSVVAVDALGQEGASTSAAIKLPEKIFLQPLARSAIEIRKEVLWERRPYAAPVSLRPDQTPLMLGGFDMMYGTARDIVRTDEFDPTIERAPRAIRRAGRMIDSVTFAPQDGYFQDLAVFAGFRAARSALNIARDIDDTNVAAGLLWEVALAAEYGSSADARRALEEAQRQLMDAIARGDQEAIERLSDVVRQAMRNYMQALANEARRNGQQQSQEQQRGDAQDRQQRTVTRDQLEEIMREIERLAKEGRTEEAQRLLEQLQQMMANLEMQMQPGGQPQQGQNGEGQQGDQNLNESVEGLSDAIGQQRGLRDETQRQEQQGQGQQPGQQQQGQQGQGQQGQGQQGQQGQQGGQQRGQQQGQGGQNGENGEQLAQRQGALRRALNEARQNAEQGGSRDNGDLDRADQAMGRAEEALRRGDYGAARNAQDEALRQMRGAAQRLAEQSERDQNAREGQRDDKNATNAERDPLGRPMGGMDTTGDQVAVPEAIERERVRDILDELRRRVQDPQRSEAERAYLRRLLERFSQ